MRENCMTVRIVVSVVILVGATFSTAFGYDFQDCTETCNTNCRLIANVDCINADGIILSGGADLDMNGKTISCSSNCPAAAVKIAAGSSSVKNTGGGTPTITGAFTYGVNCQNQSTSEVLGIYFEDIGGTAIKDCAKVSNNVVLGDLQGGTIGIGSTGVANSDYVRDNYVEGVSIGIAAVTSKNVLIEENQIVLRDMTGGASEIGINTGVLSGSPTITITHNGFAGDATLAQYIAGTTGVTATENFCDPDSAMCQSCGVSCRQPPTVPY